MSPSGLINPNCIAFIGSGVVVHIPSLFNELDTLERKGTFISRPLYLDLQFNQPRSEVLRPALHLGPGPPRSRVSPDRRRAQGD